MCDFTISVGLLHNGNGLYSWKFALFGGVACVVMWFQRLVRACVCLTLILLISTILVSNFFVLHVLLRQQSNWCRPTDQWSLCTRSVFKLRGWVCQASFELLFNFYLIIYCHDFLNLTAPRRGLVAVYSVQAHSVSQTRHHGPFLCETCGNRRFFVSYC